MAEDFLTEVAAALGVDALEAGQTDDLLDLTREVAHGTERRYGPLTTYLIGQAVAAGLTHDEAVGRVRSLLPSVNEH